MAVALRCPDCRAKLRLAEEPEPGSEVECPECDAVFPAPDLETGETPDSRSEKKPKKGDGGDAKTEGDKPKASKPKKDKTPRKRKARKKETNKGALVAVVAGGVCFLILVVSLLGWYFTRKPASYEMMKYLPEDSNEAVGLNLGHMHKYAEFIKKIEPSYSGMGFHKAIETVAKALGLETNDLPDYVVEGWGKSGSAVVIRSKKEFDPEDLKKLPGAQEGKADGNTYYSISPIPALWGGKPLKVFAPSNRIIVVCEYGISGGTFSNMMAGNPDGNTLPKRLGSLGKRISRGTFWWFRVMDTTNRRKEPKQEADQPGQEFDIIAAKTTASGNGEGFKASLGSLAIRFEYALWFEDSERASELYKTAKQNEIVKAQDDSSVEPPRWWKDFTLRVIGNKKAELMVNLGCKASGNLFIIYSECETKTLMEALSGLVGKMTGRGAVGMGMPGGGGMGPGGGRPGGGRPGGSGMPPPGGGMPQPGGGMPQPGGGMPQRSGMN